MVEDPLPGSDDPDGGGGFPGRPAVQVPNEVLLAVGVYLSIVGLVATFGNGSFIAVLLRCRAFRRDAHLILLLSMSICDFGISIFGYPFTIVSCFAGSWIFGEAICKMYSFMCYTLSMISANTLVCISVFRYIIICKPHMKHKLTPRLSCICMAGAILYALIWTATPFMGWSDYVLEPWGASCSFDWYDTSIGGITYAIATIIFCYLIHLVILGWCYHQIHQRVSQLKLDPQTTPAPLAGEDFTPTTNKASPSCCQHCFCFDSGLTFESLHPRNPRSYNLEIQVLKLNVLMVMTFFVIWSPYAVVSIISLYYTDLPAFWYIFPTVFAKTSCMMNPLLYGLTNASLRAELRRLWTCQRRPDPRDVQLNRLASQEGGDGRALYDKEGMYIGKVNQGTCTCSGCTEARREVELLMRIQNQRSAVNRDSSEVREQELGTSALLEIPSEAIVHSS